MSLQNEITAEMHVKTDFNAEQETREIIEFIKNYVIRYPFIESLVLGISGGQDSTLAGRLCQMAAEELREAGRQCQFIAIRLPYGNQKDSSDAEKALDFIQADKEYNINIKPAVDASIASLNEAGISLTDFQKGNEKARERMKVQYSTAAFHKGIVIGTDHSAESITGFYTKFGDGGADLVPLFGLNKRQGKAMLRHLNCPEELITKIPTADLEDNKPLLADEEALGVTYEQIDDYLEGRQIDDKARETLEGHYLKTQHKRMLPVTRYNIDQLRK